jgi:hypothetical protein
MDSINGVSVASIAPKTITDFSTYACCRNKCGYFVSSTHSIIGHAITGKPGTNVVGAVGVVHRSLLARGVLHAFADQRLGARMQFKLEPERLRRALARMVVGRSTDAAAGEHDVAGRERVLEHGDDARGLIAHVLRPRQLQPARGEQLDDLGHVLVGALAREDLVAHDDETECLLRHPRMLTLG